MRNWMQIVTAIVVIICSSGMALAVGLDQGGAATNAPIDPHAQMVGPSLPPAPTPDAATAPAGADASSLAVGPVDDRTAFEKALNFDRFRLLSIQHLDTVKIVDSWARQTLGVIRNRQTIDGQDPVYTCLDIALRKEAWINRNIIYVQAIPIREQLMQFAGSPQEADRLKRTGLVSYAFLDRPEVQDMLMRISQDVRQAQAAGRVEEAHDLFKYIAGTLLIVPPDASRRTHPWHHPVELLADVKDPKAAFEEFHQKDLPAVPGYTTQQAEQIKTALEDLALGWEGGDAALANKGLNLFADILPTIDPAGYPSHDKRETELWYNKTFYGTIANVFLYFISMVLFLMVAVGVTQKLEKPALIVFAVAVAVHVTAMGIRWWLAGRIPIQNEFESVLGSAMIGCVVGLALELWKRKGIFGTAFSFVGFLAMTACFSCQYVFGKDIGGAIGRTKGILANTYWLYIHVNVVIGSYALIAASFLIGIVYLSLKLWYWVNPVEPGDESALPLNDDLGGSAPRTGKPLPTGGSALAVAPALSARTVETTRLKLLDGLDQANMVILQMAFWFLGMGIICGAIWADHSWGRPWGWDPKETFALVTWIVYLIIVHLRFVTPPKKQGDWTAWLSVVGFAVMMFNWIGVNFFLVGLHSYA